jgi:homoserine O-acetyltransferase
MRSARAMALLNYRTFQNYIDRQTDVGDLLDGFKASSYVSYQGEKLAKRFYPHCYYHLTRTLDTHNIGRGRGGVKKALTQIRQNTITIGVNSDKLIPPSEQKFLAQHIPDCTYQEVFSAYGHDGFLIETQQIQNIVSKNLSSEF